MRSIAACARKMVLAFISRVFRIVIVLSAVGWIVTGFRGVSLTSCQDVSDMEGSPAGLSLLYFCKGSPYYELLPHLWRPVTAVIRCSLDKQGVFTAGSLQELQQRVGSGETAWCGWRQLWKGGPCELMVSPFQDVYIAAILPQGYSYSAGICSISASASTSSWMLGGAAAGVALFLLAAPLSTSVTFRVTSGGVLFSLGSVIIVMFIMLRLLPRKRALFASIFALGSSGVGILRWATGHWLPAPVQVVNSKFTLLYLVCSSLVGAAVTYVYGGTDNPRINTVVRAFLQLLGVMLMYAGMWTHLGAFASAAATLVLGHLVVPHFRRRLQQAKLLRESKEEQKRQQQQRVSPEPIAPSQHTQPTSAATAKTTIAASRQAIASASAAATAGTPAADNVPSRSRTPIHLRRSPPSPWLVSESSARKEQQNAFVRYGLDSGDEENDATSVGRGRGGAAAAVFTFDERMAGVQHSPLRSRGGSTPPPAGLDVSPLVSPLVKSGLILNVETGRPIKIAGDLYNKLTESGYTPDLRAGLLSPPVAVGTPGSEQKTPKGSARRRGRD